MQSHKNFGNKGMNVISIEENDSLNFNTNSNALNFNYTSDDEEYIKYSKKFLQINNDSRSSNLLETNANELLDLIDYNANEIDINEGKEHDSFTTSSILSNRKSPILDLHLRKQENKMDNNCLDTDKESLPDVLLNDFFSNKKDWNPKSHDLWRSGPSKLLLEGVNSSDANKDFSTEFQLVSNEESQDFNSLSRAYSQLQLDAKVEMVCNLISMLGTNNRKDMSKTFLAMSSSVESCHAMRQSGCLPLLVQLIYSSERDAEIRSRAAQALHNIVHAQNDDKRKRREIRVLKLLHQIREYCDNLQANHYVDGSQKASENEEKHPVAAIGALMKFSFDAEHRQTICTLGGLHAIAELIQIDHEEHGLSCDNDCTTLRRFAGMSLTNLTFGDVRNKALLCSLDKFMLALVDQLKTSCEDLLQVTASVLRNLSWRADAESKQVLQNVGAVTALTVAGMKGKKESTQKSILSALWNLSAHCSANKVDICSVPGALSFLIKMLRYNPSSNTLAIVENAGGILRNVSSHIAVKDEYRQILRENNCFEILLEQLKSPSLTIVSNACGTLWNLSARCEEDQNKLWEMGAPSMLRNLVQSKHKMIAMGSSAALKNLLTANPNGSLTSSMDSTARSLGLQNLPSLTVRKQRALKQEIDITLTETCDNIESNLSPTHEDDTKAADSAKGLVMSMRSNSRESVVSAKSDSACEKINRLAALQKQELSYKSVTMHESLKDSKILDKADQKMIKRYKTSMIPTLTHRKKLNEKKSSSKESLLQDKDAMTSTVDGASTNNVEENKTKRKIPVLKTRPKSQILSNPPINIPQSSDDGLLILNHNFSSNQDLRNLPINSSNFSENASEKTTSHSSFENADLTKKSNSRTESVKEQKSKLNFKIGIPSSKNIIETRSQNSLKENTQDTELVCKTSDIPVSKHVMNLQSKSEIPNSLNKKSSSTLNLNDCQTFFKANASINNDSKNDQCNTDEPLILSNQKKNKEFLEQSTNSDLIISTTKEHEKDKTSCNFHFTGAKVADITNNTKEVLNSKLLSWKQNKPEKLNIKNCKCGEEFCTCTFKSVKPEEFLKKKLNYTNAKKENCVGNENDFISSFPTNSNNLSYHSDHKSPTDNNFLTPNFKIGSEITNFFDNENMKKSQEVDMSFSINSQMSVPSCSSFLDTEDCSLLDVSDETLDFDEFETYNNNVEKKEFKFLNPNDKSFMSNDFISLPSYGSVPYDALDLDNSIISIASLTSEMADSHYSQDFDYESMYNSKNYQISDEECISKHFNVQSSDNNFSVNPTQYFTSDLTSSKEFQTNDTKKKFTPKERRLASQDRYRTYTIRDFKGNLVIGNKNFNEDSVDKLNENKIKENPEKILNEELIGTHKIETNLQNELGPDERKEIIENAKLVALSLKIAVQDVESQASSIFSIDVDSAFDDEETDLPSLNSEESEKGSIVENFLEKTSRHIEGSEFSNSKNLSFIISEKTKCVGEVGRKEDREEIKSK